MNSPNIGHQTPPAPIPGLIRPAGNSRRRLRDARLPRLLPHFAFLFLIAAGAVEGQARARPEPAGAARVKTFAQFLQKTGRKDFIFTNRLPASATFQTRPDGTPVFFQYANIVGLPDELKGMQSAHLSLMAHTAKQALTAGRLLLQPFEEADQNTLLITRDSPAAEGRSTRVVLLRVTFTGALHRGAGGGAGSLSASAGSGQTVTFSSDFLEFPSGRSRDMALSLSSIEPSSVASGSGLPSFRAAASGTFSSEMPSPHPRGRPVTRP